MIETPDSQADRLGKLFLATEPHPRFTDRLVEAPELELPNGLAIPGRTEMMLSRLIGPGTLAVAIEYVDAHQTKHLPLRVSRESEDFVRLTALPDLWFTSNRFGYGVGELDPKMLDSITNQGAALVRAGTINFCLQTLTSPLAHA